MNAIRKIALIGMVLAGTFAGYARSGEGGSEETPKDEYARISREYRKVSRELDRAVRDAKKTVKKGQPSATSYNKILTLRDRKDLLYTRITFMALRHGFELPKERAKTTEVKVDPQGAFSGAKALVLEELAGDVAKVVAAICIGSSFKSSACATLAK